MILSGAANMIDNSLFYDVGFPKFTQGAIDTNLLYKSQSGWTRVDMFQI